MNNLVEGAVKLANDTRRSAFIEAAELADAIADRYDADAFRTDDAMAVAECRSAEDAMRKFARMLEDMAGD